VRVFWFGWCGWRGGLIEGRGPVEVKEPGEPGGGVVVACRVAVVAVGGVADEAADDGAAIDPGLGIGAGEVDGDEVGAGRRAGERELGLISRGSQGRRGGIFCDRGVWRVQI
jgi:hypothetical protein